MEVSIEEAAVLLGCSNATVRRRIATGKLQSRTEDGRVSVILPDREQQPSSSAAQVSTNDTQALLEEKDRRIEDLVAAIEVYQATIASLQQSESELRQLLLQAQFQVSALLPKLEAPREEERSKAWWRWW